MHDCKLHVKVKQLDRTCLLFVWRSSSLSVLCTGHFKSAQTEKPWIFQETNVRTAFNVKLDTHNMHGEVSHTRKYKTHTEIIILSKGPPVCIYIFVHICIGRCVFSVGVGVRFSLKDFTENNSLLFQADGQRGSLWSSQVAVIWHNMSGWEHKQLSNWTKCHLVVSNSTLCFCLIDVSFYVMWHIHAGCAIFMLLLQYPDSTSHT